MTRRFAIAHRAGNDLDTLRAAESWGVDLVEADVHLHRGRLEVRHLKTLGPIPILWDRWRLANPFAPRLMLHELLARAAPETELMLDLKGRRRALAEGVAVALGKVPDRAITICARHWPLLERFGDVPRARLVHSVGRGVQLRRLLRRYRAGCGLHGVSVHERLLDRDTVQALRARADLVMCWGVSEHPRAQELRDWGVNGIIATDRELLRRFAAPAGAVLGGPDQGDSGVSHADDRRSDA